MLRRSVKEIQSMMTQSSDHEKFPLKFYWSIIGAVCKKLERKFSLYEHHRVLKEIGPIHCHMQVKLEELPDVRDFLSLVRTLKTKLNELKALITTNQANFDEIRDLLNHHEFLKGVAERFGIEKVVVDKTLLKGMCDDFVTCHQEVSILLIKSHPKQNW